jgi:hypothetical protein
VRLTCRKLRPSVRVAKCVLPLTLVVRAAIALPAPADLAATAEHRFVLVAVVDQAGEPALGLGPGDFTVETGSVSSAVVDVMSASYPLAIILDNSSYGRGDFQLLRAAVKQFVDRLPPRKIAVYSSGVPVSRVEDFTTDKNRVTRAVASPVAAPNSATETLDTILRASKDLALLHEPVTGIVTISTGGTEMSPPPAQQVWSALMASGIILNVIEKRALRLDSGVMQRSDDAVLEALAARTRGKYVRGTSAAVYASGLQALQRQLEAQYIVEYMAAREDSNSVSVRVKSPSIIVMARALDH